MFPAAVAPVKLSSCIALHIIIISPPTRLFPVSESQVCVTDNFPPPHSYLLYSFPVVRAFFSHLLCVCAPMCQSVTKSTINRHWYYCTVRISVIRWLNQRVNVSLCRLKDALPLRCVCVSQSAVLIKSISGNPSVRQYHKDRETEQDRAETSIQTLTARNTTAQMIMEMCVQHK